MEVLKTLMKLTALQRRIFAKSLAVTPRHIGVNINLTSQCRKMVRHTLKILQHLLQDF